MFKKVAKCTKRRVIIRVREVERAVKVLNEKGYPPEIANEYIVVQTAESAEINVLISKWDNSGGNKTQRS